MASIIRHSKGYRVHAYVHGVRDSGTFRTKREARRVVLGTNDAPLGNERRDHPLK